jgi:hypothetical protein
VIPGGATLAPVSPCAPWCAVPDPDASGYAPEDHPEWCCAKVDDADLTDPVTRARLEWVAGAVSSLLFRMSGYRYNGGCTTEEFLCLRQDPSGCWRLGWGADWRTLPVPAGDGLTWRNIGCGSGSCDCSSRRIQLPYGPVVSIESLTIGDALIPEANYELVGDSIYLCDDSLDADACFDACAGTGLLVAWTWGEAPPPDGITAACVFTCELYKACTGQACQLPRRVRTVSKPGMAYELLDPMDFLEHGRTGIYEVDLFLGSVGGTVSTVTFPEDVAPIDFASRARARW